MSTYTVAVSWQRGSQPFIDNKYSRRHSWRFDGGLEVPASSSPHVVPLPYSDANAVDPEEAFVASVSSCHMLWFLSIAAKRRFCVDSYIDEAVGTMAKNASGKMAMTQVTLRPRVVFAGDRLPDRAEIDAMHHEAHVECFIANSVLTEVKCEPVHLGAGS
jgi:organic hydroperoxide reductase OsmC/OhrA